MEQGKVAVVGSGAAGLAAAFRLHRAGYQVRLLERGDRLGGRMRTVVRNGFLIEEGPSRLTRAHRSILRIVADAGLAAELVPVSSKIGIADGKEIHYLDAARLLRDTAASKLVSTSAKLALLRLLVDLVRYRRRLDVADLSRMRSLDHVSVEWYARSRLGDEAFEKVIDPCVRALVIGHSDELSVADLLYVFRSFLASGELVAFRAGMGSYPRALGPLFDATVGAEVLAARESSVGVSVAWRDRRGSTYAERVAGVVLACDAPASARIHQGLDEASRAFLAGTSAVGVRYRSLVHVNLAVREAPDIPACSLFPVREHHPRLVGVRLEHNTAPGRAPEGKGVIGVYPTPRWSDALIDEPDDVVTKHLVDEAEAIVPGLSGLVEFAHLSRARPAVMNSRPGYWTALAEFRRRRSRADRRIQLAGDYFCTSSVNAASVAGERAARDLLAAIG